MPKDQTFHFTGACLADGWARDVRLEVRGGLVAAIERGVPAKPGDERHGTMLAGLPNLHSHAFQRAMAGLTERRGASDDSFWTWRERMYSFVARIGPDEMAAIAALAFMEMLEGGFTRVAEFHYLHHDLAGRPYADRAEMARAIARAADEAGIGLTLLPVFYAHSGFGGATPTDGQRRFIHDRDGYAALHQASAAALADLPDAVLGVAPHSLRAVTGDELRQVAALAGNSPVHIHIAEQRREVEECLAWSGQRPVEWLYNNVSVDPRWCLVHATHVEPDEITAIADSGAAVGLCPITEANLGDGVFPATAFQLAGGRFGVGSDSNVRIDVSEELRLLEYGQRLNIESRNVMAGAAGASTGEALYTSALVGGAQACGVAVPLSIGAPADFITLDASHPSIGGVDGYIFSAGREAVDGVWRRGQQIVSAGRHHRREGIVARYRDVLQKLLA